MFSSSDFQLHYFSKHCLSHCKPLLCQIHCSTPSSVLTWSIDNTWPFDHFFFFEIFFWAGFGDITSPGFSLYLTGHSFSASFTGSSSSFDLSTYNASCSILKTGLFSLSSLPRWSRSGLWCVLYKSLSLAKLRPLLSTPDFDFLYIQCLHIPTWISERLIKHKCFHPHSGQQHLCPRLQS